MKRLLFGLFAAGVALSMSAFTTFTPKKKFNAFFYVLVDGSTYHKVNFVPDPDNCLDNASYKCYLGYLSDQGSSFLVTSIPPAPFVQSTTKGLYTQ